MRRGAIQSGITRARVLDLVRNSKQISRIEISRQLSMDRSSMTHVVKDLLFQGILCEEEGSSPVKSGRKPVLLSIDGKFGSLIGMELQPGILKYNLMNMNGLSLTQGEIRLKEYDPQIVIDQFLDNFPCSDYPPLLGAVIALPGIVDPYKGVLLEALPLGLRNYPLSHGGKDKIPLLIDNDANCFARSILHEHEDRNHMNMICLIGESHRNGRAGLTSRDDIGIGIVINGNIYYGSHFKAGEPGGIPFFEKPLVELVDKEKGDYLLSLFKYLESTLYLLDTESLHMGGELGSYGNYEPLIKSYTPENCHIHFNKTDPYEVARGGAFLFLDQLFTPLPTGEMEDCLTRINWKNILKSDKEEENESPLCK